MSARNAFARSLFLALFLLPGFASAQFVVWDQGPGTGGYGGSFENKTDEQNFADSVLFASDTLVSGINYFSAENLSDPGNVFHIKVLADVAGEPGAVLHAFDLPFSAYVAGFATLPDGNDVVDINRVSFSFAPITFLANTTYWVGVSGNDFDAAQVVVFPSSGDGQIAFFPDGPDLFGVIPLGDQMFQLLTPVPEPRTWASMIAGLAVLGFALRRRVRHAPA